MKKGPDALDTAQNESWSAKHDPVPVVLSKTGLGAQNMKMEPDALVTAPNESWSV
jgi:hypothetical protein